jgi:predicted MFS family arabinose efflux permease
LGGEGDDGGQPTEVRQRFRDAGRLLRNPAILALVLVSSLRDMGSVVLMFWLAKYLHDPIAEGGLEFSAFMVGLHLTLLLILGVVSSPIAGVLSDRFGRKLILIPCLTAVGLLSLAIEPVGAGILLIVIVLSIGLFSSSMNQILQATVLDQVGRGTEGMTMGIVMGVNSVLSGIAPLIAALVVNRYGLGSVFVYAAVLWVSGAVVLAFTPLRPPPGVAEG